MNTRVHTSAKDSSAVPVMTPSTNNLLQCKCGGGGSGNLAGGCGGGCGKNQPTLQLATRKAELDSRTWVSVPETVRALLRSPEQSPSRQSGTFGEPSFSHDFSRVPVHARARGSESSSSRPTAKGHSGSELVHKPPQTTFEPPSALATRMVGGLKVSDSEDEGAFVGGNGTRGSASEPETLSYRESNELLECIRIMGQENAESCREQVRNPANWGTHSAIVATDSNTAGPPSFTPCGEFKWWVAFNTSGRNGFLVQEITNVYQARTCAGAVIANPHPTPLFYEAWGVGASGAVTPQVGGTNDMWERPPRPNTRGNWSLTGKVHWAANLEPAAGFAPYNVPDAGLLQSTLTRPTNIANPILTRHKAGTWDCCAGSNTHTET